MSRGKRKGPARERADQAPTKEEADDAGQIPADQPTDIVAEDMPPAKGAPIDLSRFQDEQYARDWCRQPWDLALGSPPIEAALAFAAVGVRVHPCYFWINETGQQKKRTHISDAPNQATTDPERIKALWTQYPRALIGGFGGDKFLWLDLDRKAMPDGSVKDGHEVWPDWDKSAVITRTPNDGHHVWHHVPTEGPVKELWDKLINGGARTMLAKRGADIQTGGKYVILPGSVFPDGRRYEFHKGGLSNVDMAAGPATQQLLLAAGFGRKSGRPKVDHAAIAVQEEAAAAERPERARKQLEEWLAPLIELGGGSGSNNELNNTAYRMGAFIREDWLGREEVENRLLDVWLMPGLGEREGRRTIASGIRGGIRKATLPVELTGGFIKTDAGNIVANSQHNIRVALSKLEIVPSYDEFADQPFFQRGGRGNPIMRTDALINGLWLEVERAFRFRPTNEYWWHVITDLEQRNSFHPVRDYLDRVVDEWDGQGRIDTWLTTYGGAQSTPYNNAVSRLALLAAARRILEPGCKLDEMPILESPQGLGKSTAWNTLAGDEWFLEQFDLRSKDKKLLEQTTGHWFVECAELAGMRESDVEHVKTQLSTRFDKARMSYARSRTNRKRQFVFVGTTNATSYLHDSTGNRRFLPVKVQRFDIKALKRDRDQLWGEAVARVRAGESIGLDESLWATAAVEQDARRGDEPWEATLDDVLGSLEGKLLQEDAWDLVGVEVKFRDQKKARTLRNAMEKLRFEKTKLRFEDGRQLYCYVRGPERGKSPRIYVSRELVGGGAEDEGREARYAWRARIEEMPESTQEVLDVIESGQAHEEA